ncbi:MAG TPA: YegS/Rv2252/BmrU family lipid kinase [Bacteroidia bacterium]|jgi:diacylglycerol kinase (ATP)|nr:YegS/Rv2252/BmrU family lipid kinase [Bacteroidia bacterium]
MKTMFIINPISGKGKRRKPQKTIQKIEEAYTRAGADFEIRLWDRLDRIDELIRDAVEGKFDVVVAAGGDGTINEIGHRLVGTGIALGVIPLGSGNGFARHLGYSTRTGKALSQLLTAHAVEIDTGNFGGIPFMNNAGIGIDAEVARQFKASKTRGIHNYVRLASRAFFSFKSFSVKLVVDDKREYIFDDLMFIDITNGSQWGAGAKIAPLSTISDGYLEAIIFERASLIKVPRLLKLLFLGKLYRHPNIKMVRGKKFEITRRLAGNAHVDGEAVKLGKHIEALVREKSMKLLVPKRTELV